MSDQDKSRKTEKPTPHKLRELRKKGQVAKSKDVTSVVGLVIVLLYLGLFWKYNYQLLQGFFIQAFSLTGEDFTYGLSQLVDHGFHVFMFICLPVVGLSLLAAVIGNLIQFGFLTAADQIIPKFERVNPVKGLQRIFSSKNLIDTVKAAVKIIIVVIVMYFVIRYYIPYLTKIVHCNLSCGIALASNIIIVTCVILVFIFILFSTFDYWYQGKQFIKDNMMTRDELKRDRKSTDGDPLIKHRQRSISQENMSLDLNKIISEAILVFASQDRSKLVVLRYVPDDTPLPIITLKERGSNCQRIIDLASVNQLPVYVDDVATLPLWQDGQLNDYIPNNTIDSVAPYVAHALDR